MPRNLSRNKFPTRAVQLLNFLISYIYKEHSLSLFLLFVVYTASYRHTYSTKCGTILQEFPGEVSDSWKSPKI
jgi:hypothetical protein